ncbi:transposase [Lyngbya sp. CCY1209]|jgi:REP element-mobilizing transposase RayT|uniref:REP-associated tyrosine transposase n=1 Tax=Lyngbya sp. CCY1209 TaxID=2886103 RepID=UPI002D213AFB|nr:transposase [Lyngbya sp. CCY1209]MEB3886911.1 transposase [Lyngbya sp. CCY1209]
MEVDPSEVKRYYRRLPHWELNGAIYFITFNTWEKLELTPEARKVVFTACLFFHDKRYKMFTFVVMPDHVHLLMQPLQKEKGDYWPLASIMHSLKSYTHKEIPKVMTHIGRVWQPERYDRIVRDEQEFQQFWKYILENPIKANLSDTCENYPYLWINPEPKIN